jgi:hypothetical protein
MNEEHDIIRTYLSSLEGLPINEAWKGYGSYIFLELGELQDNGPSRHQKGEVTAAFEFDWTIENDEMVECGAHDSYVDIDVALSGLNGHIVTKAELIGLPPQLQLTLSDGRRIRSCTMQRGYPEWHVWINSELFISPEPGSMDPSVQVHRWIPDDPDDEEMQHIERTAERWEAMKIEATIGECTNCTFMLHINGNFALLDYGVCTNGSSERDGRVVSKYGGCPQYNGREPT